MVNIKSLVKLCVGSFSCLRFICPDLLFDLSDEIPGRLYSIVIEVSRFLHARFFIVRVQ